MKTTSEVMADYLQVFDSRDSVSMASLYSENAFVIWGNRKWHGREEIADFYHEIFNQVLPPDTVFDANTFEVIEKDVAYVVWSGSSSLGQVKPGVDTFVVSDGEIQSLTVYIESDF